MSTRIPDPDSDFGVLLALAYQAFVRELNAYHAQAGFEVKPQYGYVFRALLKQDLTATSLGVKLGITTQGAAKLIDEMGRIGYVEKHADPNDARVRVVRLAERGHQAVRRAREFHQAYEDRLAERYGAEDAAAVRRVLQALVDDTYQDTERVLRLA